MIESICALSGIKFSQQLDELAQMYLMISLKLAQLQSNHGPNVALVASLINERQELLNLITQHFKEIYF